MIAEHATENGHEPLSDEMIEQIVSEAQESEDALELFDLRSIYDFMDPSYAEDALAQTVLAHLTDLANLQFAIRGAQKANRADKVAEFTQAQTSAQYTLSAITKRFPGTLALARQISTATAKQTRQKRAEIMSGK